MNVHPKINSAQSIQSRKIVLCDISYLRNKLGYLLNAVMYLIYIGLALALFSEIEKYNELPDIIFYFVLAIFLGISIYGFYRAINYDHLDKIEHNLNNFEAKKSIIEYFKKQKCTLIDEYENVLVIKTKTFNYHSYYTLINTDNILYFNIINEGFRKSGPSALGHIIFKSNFKHYLRNNLNTYT